MHHHIRVALCLPNVTGCGLREKPAACGVIHHYALTALGSAADLDEYRLRQKEIAEEKERAREQRELDQTIEEMEMLKRILEDITKDLPDVKPSIMYVPIEPKPDAFMSKTIDGYLDFYNIEVPKIDDDETDET